MKNQTDINNIIVKNFKVQGLDLIITTLNGKIETIENGLSEIILGNLSLSSEKGIPLTQDEILSSIHMSVGADAVYIKEQFKSDLVNVTDTQSDEPLDEQMRFGETLSELQNKNQQLKEALSQLEAANEQQEEQINTSNTKLNQAKQQLSQKPKAEEPPKEKSSEVPFAPPVSAPFSPPISSSSASVEPAKVVPEKPKSPLFMQGGLTKESDSAKIGDKITQNNMPTFKGVFSPDAKGYLLLDGQKYAITADTKGQWSFALTTPLKDGKYQYELIATRDDGESITIENEITIDTQLDSLSIGLDKHTDSGLVGDGITGHRFPIFTGMAEIGSQVILTIGNQKLSTLVNEQGVWRIALGEALPEGDSHYQVTAVDVAGNEKTETSIVTVKTSPPIFTLQLDGKTDFKTRNTQPILSGKTEAAAEVLVTIDNKNYSTQADTQGNWSLSITNSLADGTHLLSVQVTDIVGNISNSTHSLWVDTIAPSSDASLAAEYDSGLVGDNLTNKQNISLVGITKPLAKIQVSFAGENFLATANNDGQWRVALPKVILDGDYDYQISVMDSLGNHGQSSGQFTLDTSIELTASLDSASQSETIPDGITTHQSRPQISGVSDPESKIIAEFKGNIKTVYADKKGAWSLVFDVNADVGADNNYTVTAEDVAGNTKTLSQKFNFYPATTNVSETPPPTLSVALHDDADSGNKGDYITQIKAPKFVGLATTGTDITFVIDGKTYTAKADKSTGIWEIAVEALPEGNNSYTATAKNPSNGKTTKVFGSVFIDTVTPSSSVELTAETATGTKGGFITTHRKPVFTGQGESNCEVVLTLDNETVSTRTDEHGRWSLSLNKVFPESFKGGFKVSIKDSADNLFERNGTLVIDNSKPELSKIELISSSRKARNYDGLSSNDLTPTFRGKASKGAELSFSFSLNSKKYTFPISEIDKDGNWTFGLPKGILLKNKRYILDDIKVKAVSIAGNEVEKAFSHSIQIQDLEFNATSEVAAESSMTGQNDPYLSASKTPKLQGTLTRNFYNDEVSGYVEIAGKQYGVSIFGTGRSQWSVQLPPEVQLPEGRNDYTLMFKDAYGGEYKLTSYVTVSDFKYWLDPDTDSGQLGDNYTNHKKPIYKGKAVIGAKLSARVNDEIHNIVVNDKGEWQFEVPIKQDGTYDITFIQNHDGVIVGKTTLNIDSVLPTFQNWWSHWGDTHPDSNIAKINDPRVYFVYKNNISHVLVEVNGKRYTQTNKFSEYDGKTTEIGGRLTLPNGEHLAKVTAFDKAGNKLEHEVLIKVLGDEQGKNPPQIELGINPYQLISAENGKIAFNKNSLKLQGTTTPASIIEVKDANGKVIGTAKADNSGAWDVTLPNNIIPVGIQQDESVTLSITAEDLIGRETNFNFDLVYDNIPPEITGDVDDILSIDHQVNTGTPSFSGKTDAYAEVNLTINSQTYSVRADKNGDWKIILPNTHPLNDGLYDYEIKAQNLLGLTSTKNIVNTLTIKTLPSIDSRLTEDTDTGVKGDAKTKINTPEIIGTTEPNANVRVVFNDNIADAYETQADAQGNWTIQVTSKLAEGSHKYQIFVEDPVQQIKGEGQGTLVIDTTAPNILTGGVTDDLNKALSDDLLTQISTPTFSGLSEPFAHIHLGIIAVSHHEQREETIIADENGHWQWTIPASAPLNDGKYRYFAFAEDDAGNSNIELGLSGQFTIDTTAPDLSGGLDSLSDTDLLGDNITHVSMPTFSGKTEAGLKVLLNINNHSYSEIADNQGQWSIKVTDTLADGSHAYALTVFDAAGNSNEQKGTLVVDTQAPDLSGGLDSLSDTGLLGDNITQVSTPTFSGKTEAGLKVLLNINNHSYSEIADNQGQWSIKVTDTLADGSHAYALTVFDAAGNSNEQKGTLVVDTQAPDLSGGLDSLSDTGLLGDNITHVSTPTFSGKTEAGLKVLLNINNHSYSEIADNQGQWRINVTDSLPNGAHAYELTVFDAAGNSNEQKGTLVVDTQAPDLSGGLDSLSDTDLLGDNITQVSTPTFSGKTEAGLKVLLNINNHSYSEIADNQGQWRIKVTDTLADGSHAYALTVFDAAGNSNEQKGQITIDTQAPTVNNAQIPDPHSGTQGEQIANITKPTLAVMPLPDNLATVDDIHF